MTVSLHPAGITRRLRAARLGVIRSHQLADGALRVYAYGPEEARAIAAHLIQLGCDAAAAGDRVTAVLPEPAEEPAEEPQDSPAAPAQPLTGELRHEAHCKRSGGDGAPTCTCTPRYWTRQELDAEVPPAQQAAELLRGWRYLKQVRDGRTTGGWRVVERHGGATVGLVFRTTPAHVTLNPRWGARDAGGGLRVTGAASRDDAARRLAESIIARQAAPV